MPRRDTEGVLEGHHLGDAGHGEEGDQGRELVLVDAVADERGAHRLDLGGPEPLGVAGDLGPERLAMVRQGDELDGERGPSRVGVEAPEVPQRAVLGDGPFEAGDVLLGPTAEGLDEEVVHGAEVVVHQLRLQAGSGREPPGRDRRVPLFGHQQLGGIEQLGPCLRIPGTDATRRRCRRHAATLPPPHAVTGAPVERVSASRCRPDPARVRRRAAPRRRRAGSAAAGPRSVR